MEIKTNVALISAVKQNAVIPGSRIEDSRGVHFIKMTDQGKALRTGNGAVVLTSYLAFPVTVTEPRDV